MKCVKKTNGKEAPIRVTNEKAETLVQKGSYIYCTKEEWKAGGRQR